MNSWDGLLQASGLPRLEARALLEHATGRSRSWLIAHGDEAAEPATAAHFAALADRRRAGEPLAYLTGWREFQGLRLGVDASVLIPRADTETLVALAVTAAPVGGRLLDLGTGSGAIAIAVAAARPDLRVVATDISEAALRMAASNAARCLPARRDGGPLRFLTGAWWQALPFGEPPFDLIVSNPPYIAAGDPHLRCGDLRFEPAQALASGADGLDAIRAIVAGADHWLVAGGCLMLEHGHEQGPLVRRLLGKAGWREPRSHVDAEKRERVTVAMAPDTAGAVRRPSPLV